MSTIAIYTEFLCLKRFFPERIINDTLSLSLCPSVPLSLCPSVPLFLSALSPSLPPPLSLSSIYLSVTISNTLNFTIHPKYLNSLTCSIAFPLQLLFFHPPFLHLISFVFFNLLPILFCSFPWFQFSHYPLYLLLILR